ncbi:unnamed protein product [Calypogeia fissa]
MSQRRQASPQFDETPRRKGVCRGGHQTPSNDRIYRLCSQWDWSRGDSQNAIQAFGYGTTPYFSVPRGSHLYGKVLPGNFPDRAYVDGILARSAVMNFTDGAGLNELHSSDCLASIIPVVEDLTGFYYWG